MAIVLGVIGLVVWGQRGQAMVAAAVALGSLAGLELSVREHLAGYRSHTTLLAGMAGVAVLAGSFFARVPRPVMLAGAAVAFLAAFALLRATFKRRSGGLGFR